MQLQVEQLNEYLHRHFKLTADEGHNKKGMEYQHPKQKQDLRYSSFWTVSATAVVARPTQEQKGGGRLVNSTEPV